MRINLCSRRFSHQSYHTQPPRRVLGRADGSLAPLLSLFCSCLSPWYSTSTCIPITNFWELRSSKYPQPQAMTNVPAIHRMQVLTLATQSCMTHPRRPNSFVNHSWVWEWGTSRKTWFSRSLVERKYFLRPKLYYHPVAYWIVWLVFAEDPTRWADFPRESALSRLLSSHFTTAS